MRRLGIIIFGFFLAAAARAQTVGISGMVINQYGSPVAGAKVYICDASNSTGTPCSPVASIYSDYNRTVPAANPTITDSNGDFSVYGGSLPFPNIYVVNAVPESGTTYTWLVNGPACSLSGCTFSGTVTAPIFNATTEFEVNGAQIACTNLSDCSNLAKINAANTFTGSPQTAPIFNATTQFNVNGSQIAAANLSNGVTGSGAIVLATGPALVTPNIGAATGTSVNLSGSGQFGTSVTAGTIVNATTGYQINSLAALNHVLLGNGTDYVDSASIPYSIITGGPSATTYYQTVASGGTAQTQRPTLNFDASQFTVTDSASPAETTISLSPSASTPALHKQVFTASGTFTIPTGITTATAFRWIIVGAGGAGGGGSSGVSGAGGGAGATAYSLQTGYTAGNTIDVAVGTGGTGSAGATGGNGGDSIISSGTQTITTVTAGGGAGGVGGNTPNANYGGLGGTPTGGDADSTNGGDGSTGTSNSTSAGVSGGASSFGGGGRGFYGGTSGNGSNGEAWGSGGGGGSSNTAAAGGNGASGIVIVEWIQ